MCHGGGCGAEVERTEPLLVDHRFGVEVLLGNTPNPRNCYWWLRVAPAFTANTIRPVAMSRQRIDAIKGPAAGFEHRPHREFK